MRNDYGIETGEETEASMVGEVDNHGGLIAGALILVCCAVLALFGCSQQPLAPSGTVTDPSTNLYSEDDDPAASDTVLVASATVSQLVGPGCDTLQLKLETKKIKLWIPDGALSDTVTITVTGCKYEIGKTELFIYECGPSGLQFQIPIEIQQPMPLEFNGTEISFLYFDETYNDGDGLGWEEVDRATVTGSVVRFDIHHFSKYGISYRPDPVTNEESNDGQNEQ